MREEGFYLLKTPEEVLPVLVAGYYCTDLSGAFAFGFNTVDGGGLLPASELTKETTLSKVAIVPSGSFGFAIEAAKEGHKIARSGWNGKGMWVMYVGCSNPIITSGSIYYAAGLKGHTSIGGHLDMRTADGSMQPGWNASQQDMLANDWCIVE